MDNKETDYYKSVCDIQDKFIRGEISREEMEQKLEIERQKFIQYLQQQNLKLQNDNTRILQFNQLLENLGAATYRYNSTKTERWTENEHDLCAKGKSKGIR